jgi:putative phosphoribosyl transferase
MMGGGYTSRTLFSAGPRFAFFTGMRGTYQAAKVRLPILNRVVAGQELAKQVISFLGRYGNGRERLVLGLPRGGVPVAVEVARALNAPIDIMMARKLGTPGRPELAMGAVASGSGRVLNPDIVEAYGVSSEEIAEVEMREREEIERRLLAYRGQRPLPHLQGCIVVLVDDGLATGATMRAAIHAAREAGAYQIIVAVPVAPPETLRRLRPGVDKILCLATPVPFFAIAHCYRRFDQLTDEEVISMLEEAWKREESMRSPSHMASPA